MGRRGRRVEVERESQGLGVPARDGEFAGDLGVMVAGAARAGKKGLACGPSVAAREGARCCWLRRGRPGRCASGRAEGRGRAGLERGTHAGREGGSGGLLG